MAVLQIRETQMRALREITTIYSVEGGLQQHFPDPCQELGPARLQQFVENSIDTARELGFEPAQYLAFASLQMVFGESFWLEEEHRWAKEILEDRFLWTPKHRMHELRQAAIFYLAKVAEQEPVVIESEAEEEEEAEAIES